MKSKNERIEELEEALKESVKITAEREMVMVDLQSQLEEAERKVMIMLGFDNWIPLLMKYKVNDFQVFDL